MIVLLSADSEIEREALKNSLLNYDCVSEVRTAENIKEAFGLMKIVIYDAVILYIKNDDRENVHILTEIQKIKKINENTVFIIMTDEADETFSSAAAIFGIDYIFIRPYNLNEIAEKALPENIRETAAERERISDKKTEVEKLTSSILSSSGIFPHLKGYRYLKEAIVTGYINKDYLDAITKYLYPSVAKDNNTTADRVERAIRHAIESAWNRCSGNGFYDKMGFGTSDEAKRPTNSEYIFAVVEYLNNHI